MIQLYIGQSEPASIPVDEICMIVDETTIEMYWFERYIEVALYATLPTQMGRLYDSIFRELAWKFKYNCLEI
jgi:hypothetical protein